MKYFPFLSAAAALGLVSCGTSNQSFSSSDFDPLLVPGSSVSHSSSARIGFRAHDLVRAAMDNTGFYKKKPKDNAEADKLLSRGTSMKVIRSSGSFLQVELDATGEVGYVPEVMVESAAAAATTPAPAPGSEYQVYPPLPGDGQIPADGSIVPLPEPPGGPIPTVIDPNAPGSIPPVPEVPDLTPQVPSVDTTAVPAVPEIPAPAAEKPAVETPAVETPGDAPPPPPAKPEGFPEPVPPIEPKDSAES